ncbi:hypothetical protein BT93_A2233 [Corymbia citriodora subsp. variegata]|nr:hypothetical protein BT93_A2233 [Corymbia citriodora subsp. variegata]
MDLVHGFRAKSQYKMTHLNGANLAPDCDSRLVIQLPKSRFLRVVSRSLFLAVAILTLPCLGSLMKSPHSRSQFNALEFGVASDMSNLQSMNFLFHDLSHEGLLKKGDKALVVSSGIGQLGENLQFLDDNEIDFALESDVESQSLIPDRTFDFALVSGSADLEFVDRVVKIGGILAVQLGNDPSDAFTEPSNYKIVYMRRYDCTIVAMRKVASDIQLTISSTKRRLCDLALEAKKATLKGLEDVWLEPPRRALIRSGKYLKKIKYLPELLGDSLQGYNRRNFIAVGSQEDGRGMVEWFRQNYPTQNQHFEVHHLETGSAGAHVDVSDWLTQNVREEEYVVMKAGAGVAEELMKKRVIHLVDEMLLECSSQWGYRKANKSKRAYWECLALYGRLRDAGVAVHQWWA